MISPVNPRENTIAARLLEYFSTRTHWNRGLWNVGTILALREVLEASEAQNEGHLSLPSVRGAVATALRLLTDDPGLGTRSERDALINALTADGKPRDEIHFQGLEYHQVADVVQYFSSRYLENWSRAIDSPSPPAPERTSRAIAAHLLDLGFNSNFLHRWWTKRLKDETAGEVSLTAIIAEASTLANQSDAEFHVLIPFPTELRPPRNLLPPASWLNGTQVSEWLAANASPSPGLRQQGGLLLTIQALEAESAVQHASERVELFIARVLLSLRKQIRSNGLAWVAGFTQSFSIEGIQRGIRIGAMHRENRIWLESPPDPFIDPAIELLAPLQSGTTTTAIAGGWAAIESLLGEPKNKRADPAERLAAIVACSFPRAELTDLAYALRNSGGQLANGLATAVENKDKAALVAQSILDGSCPIPEAWTERAAIDRMRELLTNPQRTLCTIRDHIQDAFSRLYRQRNLVLHAGKTRAVALRSTLRGATPLVGAGLDRISHARFVGGVVPVRLAGRARTGLETISSNEPLNCISLLGN